MPNVRNVDRSTMDGTERWLPPPSLPMCESTQVLDRRTNSPWPFLYSYKDGGCVVNTAPHRSKYAEAQDIGEALI